MTIDAKKQNDKTKTDKQNSDISEDGTEILEEPKKNKKGVVATELASEQVSNFTENNLDENDSLATNKRENLEHDTLDDEACEMKNAQSETNQTVDAGKQQKQGSVFAPILFGSLSAGFLSFVALYLLFSSNLLGGNNTITEMEISLSSQIAKNSKKVTYIESALEDQILKISKLEKYIETLDRKIQQISTNLEGNSSLISDNQDLKLRIETLEELMANLGNRISSVEKRPVEEVISREVIEAYNKEVIDLVEIMAIQKKKAERILDNATAKEEKQAEIEQRTMALSALNQIRKMIETGKGFKDPLEKFQQITDATVPEVLRVAALDGIITLEGLNEGFPEAARAAIAADRMGSTYDSTIESLLAFIKSQFQGRSIVPKEGTDADAILSRVEAELKKGNLDLALSELVELQPPAADIMATWKARALQRIEVIKTIDTFSEMAE